MNYHLPEKLENFLDKEKKNWLITGVAGFIGSHLAECLLSKGHTVIGIDNFSTGKKTTIDYLKDKYPTSDFQFIKGDICEIEICNTYTQNIDYVLHQAALGSVPRSVNDPLTSFNSNVNGFNIILRSSQVNKVKRFVYASSSAVYGDSLSLPKKEDFIGNPLSPYAASKRMNEISAISFKNTYNFSCVGLRYFNVFGLRQDADSVYAAVIPLWIDSLKKGNICWINGDGTYSRDFCYINNVVQANLLAATHPSDLISGKIFNIAFGQQTTLLELFYYIRSGLNLPETIKPSFRSYRVGDVPHSLSDITQARSMIGYNPLFDVKTGLNLILK